MAAYDLMRRLTRVEKDIEKHLGDELERAFDEVSHAMKLTLRLKLQVMSAERANEPSGNETPLDNEIRRMAAEALRGEDALYRSMPHDEYMAGLPRHYICGKCGTTVGIDIERMMRFDAKLPVCQCAIDKGLSQVQLVV